MYPYSPTHQEDFTPALQSDGLEHSDKGCEDVIKGDDAFPGTSLPERALAATRTHVLIKDGLGVPVVARKVTHKDALMDTYVSRVQSTHQ